MSKIGQALAQLARTAPAVPGQAGPSLARYADLALGNRAAGAPGMIGLPRDPGIFDVPFGPMTPVNPFGIDTPPAGKERPEPRIWEYPVGWNLPSAPDSWRPIGYDNLRRYPQLFPFAAIAKRVRINEIINLDWDITIDDTALGPQGTPSASPAELQDLRTQLQSFWARPDPNYEDLAEFLTIIVEEMLTVDAVCLYPAPSLGAGRFNSGIACVNLIDGTSIKPLLDGRGGRPIPPNPAFQQYIWGVPRVDLMQLLTLPDVDSNGSAPVGQYTSDQLVYRRSYPRINSPFGFSATEAAVLYLIAGSRRTEWMLRYFDDGAMPAAFVTAPSGGQWSSERMEQYETYLNNVISADIGGKWRIKLLPDGSHVEPMKQPILSDVFDRFLVDMTCAAFDVTPSELGFSPQAGLGGAGFAQEQTDVHMRKSLIPTARFLERTINHVNHRLFNLPPELKFTFTSLDPVIDPMDRVKVDVERFQLGGITIDEMREAEGKPGYGMAETQSPWVVARQFTAILKPDGPVLLTPNGPIDLREMVTPGKDVINSGAPAGSPPQPVPKPSETANALEPSTKPTTDETQDNQEDGEARHPVQPGPSLSAKLAELHDLEAFLDRRKWQPSRPFATKALSAAQAADAAISPERLAIVRSDLEKRAASQVTINHAAALAATKLGALGVHAKRSAETPPAGHDAARAAIAAHLMPETDPDGATVQHALAAIAPAYQAAYAQGAAYWGKSVKKGDPAPQQLVAQQQTYMANFLQQAPALSEPRIHARAALYAAAALMAYHVAQVTYGPPAQLYRWDATSAEPCDLCDARNGQVFTAATLPGYPGGGGFGGPICDGGPNCKCVLTPVNDSGKDVETDLHKAAKGDPQALIDWYNAGADGQIDWGSDGDFDQCVAVAGKYIDDPNGFCQLRHIDATGMTTSQHAAESN